MEFVAPFDLNKDVDLCFDENNIRNQSEDSDPIENLVIEILKAILFYIATDDRPFITDFKQRL